MSEDILHPLSLTCPILSSTVRYSMYPEKGMIVYDSGLNKLTLAVGTAIGSASWETITSVAE